MDTAVLATYDYHHERVTTILVPDKVLRMGLGPPKHLAGLGGSWSIAALLFGASVLFPPHSAPLAFGACVFVLGAALVAICYAKGEPPRWRWGSK